MIDTVFFDWGGVIADDPGDDFLKSILRSYGATDEQVGNISRRYMQKFMRGLISEQNYWNAVMSEFDLNIPESTESVFLSWQGLKTNSDVIELVHDIKTSGRTVALLSNVIEPTYNILKSSGAYDLFDVLIASCAEGYAKPDMDIYQLALDRAAAEGERSLFIDDKQHNLDAASKFGIKTVLASSPNQFISEVRAALSIA